MIRKQNTISLLLFFCSGIVFYSCKYDVEQRSCTEINPTTVSFQAHILPLLRTQCAIPDCHSGANPTGNLNLEEGQAYTELSQNGSGYLNTTAPKHSILYTQLISTSQPMPPSGKLNECSIELVLNWIEQGALNN